MKAKTGLILIVAMVIFAIVSLWALPSVNGQSGQDNRQQQAPTLSEENRNGDGLSYRREERDDDEDDDAKADPCRRTRGATVRLPATKLYIEHNGTDGDTGVHGQFDGLDWVKLCVYDPRGRQVLEVEPKRQLKKQAMSGIFFESREPPNEEVSIADILARFPEGLYSVRGLTLDGKRMTGAATFTHDIPAAPVITFPQGDSGIFFTKVSPSNLVVTWNHVNTTLTGEPINRTGYEVIITKDVPDDPNGFSRPTFDVHVLPSETSLTVPSEFLEPGTRYELEVLVLEVSGNQTLTSLFFQTQ